MSTRIEFKNINKVEKSLKILPSLRDQQSALNATFKKAARPIIADLTKNAPKKTGVLAHSHGSITITSANKLKYVKIGAMRKKGGYHGHLLDAGTVRRHTKEGYNRGEIKPTHYFQKSWNSNIGNAQSIVINSISTVVERQFLKELK